MNPYHGPQPLDIAGDKHDWLKVLTERRPISELEPNSTGTSTIRCYFPEATERQFMGCTDLLSGKKLPLKPYLAISEVQILGIVDRVRSGVLEWALDLERRGVLGEGMTLTPSEKQAGQQVIHNHFGDVSGSQIQIGSGESTQTQTNTTTNDVQALLDLIEALDRAIARGTVPAETADELQAELATLKAQAASPKPKWEIIKATVRSFKTVAESAAGNILGELAKPHIDTLLALAAAG